MIPAASENNTHAFREDKWYYVWALAKERKSPSYDPARTACGECECGSAPSVLWLLMDKLLVPSFKCMCRSARILT
jgi:hypothetical protein